MSPPAFTSTRLDSLLYVHVSDVIFTRGWTHCMCTFPTIWTRARGRSHLQPPFRIRYVEVVDDGSGAAAEPLFSLAALFGRGAPGGPQLQAGRLHAARLL